MNIRNAARAALVAMFVSVVAACSGLVLAPADDQAARKAYEQVRTGDLDALQAWGGPEIRAPGAAAALNELRQTLPPGAPGGSKAVRWNHFTSTGSGETLETVHEYDYGDRKVAVSTALKRPSSTKHWTLMGIHVQPLATAEVEAAKFTLQGKSLEHLLFLAVVVVVPLLMVAAFVLVFVREIKPRWLWAIASIIGFGKIAMNWTTGDVTLQPVSLSLLGSGFFKLGTSVAPWVINFSIPVGAIIVLILALRRGRARQPKGEADQS